MCKAIIQEGSRKGQPCQFPPHADGYCGRHKRNKEYDERTAAGEKLCRFFFRGCNNVAKETSPSCSSCLSKLTKKTNPCKHDGCRNKVAEPGYCGKHERDKYRDEEKATGIRYCDIARGCFNLCADGKATCEECLAINRAQDNTHYGSRKALHECELEAGESIVTCCYCGVAFEKELTSHGNVSKSCPRCRDTQIRADEKRVDRVRNYSEEKRRNMQKAYDEYFRSALRRGYEFGLTLEKLQELVTSPCTYCGIEKETEINGIDRVDNSKGYTLDNVTTSCWNCNRMKYIYTTEFMLAHCASIKAKHCLDITNPYYFQKSTRSFSQNRLEAINKRKLEWALTKEEYIALRKQSCYICGYGETSVGIDRVDSSKGYIPENCRPCCFPCNIMKGDLTLEAFYAQVDRVLTYNLYNLKTATSS